MRWSAVAGSRRRESRWSAIRCLPWPSFGRARWVAWPQAGFPSAIIDPKLVGGERGHVLLQLSDKDPGKLGSAGNGLGNQSVGELDWNGKVVWQWGDKAPGGAAKQRAQRLDQAGVP